MKIDYQLASRMLHAAESGAYPSEIHGNLCGMLCGSGIGAEQAWLRQTLEDTVGGGGSRRELHAYLKTLGSATWGALEAGQMQLRLLLPEDSEPLSERVEALAHWCHGFLAGLAHSGALAGERSKVLANGEEMTELLQDFVEIARAEFQRDAPEGEDNEQAYAELVEYVRVGTQLCYEQFLRSQQHGPPSVH